MTSQSARTQPDDLHVSPLIAAQPFHRKEFRVSINIIDDVAAVASHRPGDLFRVGLIMLFEVFNDPLQHPILLDWLGIAHEIIP